MKRALALALALLALAATARADVNCKFGGEAIAADDVQTMFQYSASGTHDKSGKLSYFRLLTRDEVPGPSSGLEVKAIDVTTPGDYAMAKEPGWTSVIRLHGKDQRVTSGKFSFTRFEVSGPYARAAGTLEFTTAKTQGSCSFDVTMNAVDRDKLPH